VLRILLANAGVRPPHSKEPFTEAMVYGIAGGIGAGVFSFHYAKEDFSSFYIAGRHLWWDLQQYLTAGAERFGVSVNVLESGGVKAADSQLREALAEHGPVAVWVDAATLPYRGMPESWQGGAYHVLVVYGIDGETARIGDLTDEPLNIPLAQLAQARARIKKDKHRVLCVDGKAGKLDIRRAVRDGIAACVDSLTKPRMRNFGLDAFYDWAERLHGSSGKDSWENVFKRGGHLWVGLTSIYDFIEHYGTGGGLGRPLFAEFLYEAAEVLGDARMRAAGDRYSELGRQWTALAEAALPAGVGPLAKARQLHARKAELFLSGGAGATAEIREIWNQLAALKGEAASHFPLDENACDELRRELKERVMVLHRGEREALEGLRALVT
jgi:hypothetical protein